MAHQGGGATVVPLMGLDQSQNTHMYVLKIICHFYQKHVCMLSLLDTNCQLHRLWLF